MKIGMLTGGGDCPGLNAVIRSVTKSAIDCHEMEVYGFHDGFYGLVENNFTRLSNKSVSGILTLGGTILGTSNKANPFDYFTENACNSQDMSAKAVSNYKNLKLDCLICLGGDGTLAIANKMSEIGINVIGVPKTIDNDLMETDVTFGFDTAVSIVTEAIDRLHTTAQSHHRVMIVETMGRYAGWIALKAGIAGGGDIILIPEIPYTIDAICNKIKERNKSGKRFSIIVVAEGVKSVEGTLSVKKTISDSPDPLRLGGISRYLADKIEAAITIETRVTILGHLQRGGTPTATDRVLATLFGTEAVNLIVSKKFGYMVNIKDGKCGSAPLEKATKGLKLVTENDPMVKTARAIGTSFGDK